MDRESQIRAIGKTFEDSLIPIEKHYSKPNVYAVETLPVFPDFQVQFFVSYTRPSPVSVLGGVILTTEYRNTDRKRWGPCTPSKAITPIRN